jgi:non-specific serine/threonine protein kinase/serine/threonine-protein kinase
MLRETGDLGGAESVYREVSQGRRKTLTAEHPSTRNTQYHLADLLRTRGKLDEAEALTHDLIELDRKKSIPGTTTPGGYVTLLGGIQLERGDAVLAEKTLREALGMLRKDFGGRPNLTTFQAESFLGGSLATQKRFAEAEPLLLQSYASFKASKSVPRSQLREAVQRIIRLYEAWGREGEAAVWREERKALDAHL